jgi:hypothetical protein
MADIKRVPHMWGLGFIRKLKPCFWKYRNPPLNDGKYHFGMVAQDVDKVASRDDYGFVSTGSFYDEGLRLKLNYEEFVGPLIAAVQQLDQKVKVLEKELAEIKKNKASSGIVKHK